MSQATTKVASVEPFNPTVTTFDYAWPKEVTPLERIILAASGDLQRMLSAFFALPISIDLVFSQLSPPDQSCESASPSTPIVQKRQVHLLCEGRTVCVATSSVSITSPDCARLFLEQKYAIGQLFKAIGKSPRFALLKVGTKAESSNRPDDAESESKPNEDVRRTVSLWRQYTLEVTGFACNITEVFPDREMFLRNREWLDEQPVQTPKERASQAWRLSEPL